MKESDVPREAVLNQDGPPSILEKSPGKLEQVARSFFRRLPLPVQFLARAGLVSSVLSIMSVVSGSVEAFQQENQEPDRLSVHRLIQEFGSSAEELGTDYKKIELELPFSDSQTWYYTGGPHSDGLSHGVKYAVDFAADRITACPAPPVVSRHVTAAASGEVIVSGRGGRWFDRNHSLVVIQLENGLQTGYMHLANIEVRAHQRVEKGDVLGNPSCESPPRGHAEAAHVHFFLRDEVGRPIKIAGFALSGWRINEARGNYQGTMTKEGSQYRTAITDRCGPTDASIRRCGGIRNDLSEGDGELFELTPTSTFTPEAKVKSGVLVLDGRGDAVQIKHSESLNLREELTIEARIKLSEHRNSPGGDTILAKGTSSEPYAFWARFWKCEKGSIAAFFGVEPWGCSYETIEPNQGVDLAVTFNKHEMIFYINGQEAGRKRVEDGLTQNIEPLFIGWSPVPGNEYFTGEIDFVRLWRKVRTPEQIRADFEKGIGPITEAESEGIVGLWEFNGDFLDSTSNHNDGVPVGDAHIITDSELDVP